MKFDKFMIQMSASDYQDILYNFNVYNFMLIILKTLIILTFNQFDHYYKNYRLHPHQFNLLLHICFCEKLWIRHTILKIIVHMRAYVCVTKYYYWLGSWWEKDNFQPPIKFSQLRRKVVNAKNTGWSQQYQIRVNC